MEVNTQQRTQQKKHQIQDHENRESSVSDVVDNLHTHTHTQREREREGRSEEREREGGRERNRTEMMKQSECNIRAAFLNRTSNAP